MRRWFLALLTLLVAAQMSWAGAELCCVDELAGHAGDGAPTASLLASEQAHSHAATEQHPVCETGHCHCHHAGCATPLADAPAVSAPQTVAAQPADMVRLKSHIPAGLERPNWLRA